MDKNNSGSSGSHSDDEILKQLLDDDQFAQNLEAFNENTAIAEHHENEIEERSRQIMDYLRSKTDIIDYFDAVIEEFKLEKGIDLRFIDLVSIATSFRERNIDGESAFMYARLDNAARIIDHIASRGVGHAAQSDVVSKVDMLYTQSPEDIESTIDIHKTSLQAEILCMEDLLPEDKELFIETADQFMSGKSIDLNNPEEVLKAIISQEQAKKSNAQTIELIDEWIGDQYGIDKNSDVYKELRFYVGVSLIIDNTVVLEEKINELLQHFGIEQDEYIGDFLFMQSLMDTEEA